MNNILPQIAAALDTEVVETIFVEIRPGSQSKWAKRSPAVAGSNGIFVFDADPDRMTGHLGHEVVHTLMSHQNSFWNATPIIIEEGLATLVGYGFDGVGRVVITGRIPVEVVESLLNTRLEDMHMQEGDERSGTYRMAIYLAVLIGLERIKELSWQAHADGYATIPTDLLLEAIEEAESLRQVDGSGLAPVELDPLFGRITSRAPREVTMRLSFDFSEN